MNKITIIAEAGINHNKNFNYAKKMIKIAAQAGASIVKFQTAIPEEIVTNVGKKTKYQTINTSKKNESQLEMQKKLHFPINFYSKLIKICKENKIEFLSTAFDIKSLKYLISIGMKKIKIPSGEITNYPLLQTIGKLNRVTFLSTGMSNLNEISKAIAILKKNGMKKKNLILLQCTTDYPLNEKFVNLKVLNTFKRKFKLKVGLSDHTLRYEAPIAATALGISAIEKHFTLSRKLKGPDHKSSLEPKELYEMVKAIQKTKLILGTNKKILLPVEKPNIKEARKSIVAKKIIKKGQIFTEKNITTKRPYYGICASKWFQILGKRSKKNFKENDFIKI